MDRDLVIAAQRGDESAFTDLIKHLGDRLYATAHHILRDPGQADDAAQQAMIDIWRKLPTLKDPDAFPAWAYRILIRAAYAEAARRKRWVLRPVLVRQAHQVEPDPAGAIVERDRLDRALDTLKLDQRAVLVLKHYTGLTDSQIAGALAIPEGTVRSRLHYATRSLRATLAAGDRVTISAAQP